MTHWIQTLDNVVLATWKRVIKNKVRHQARSFLLHRHYPKAVVQSVLTKAEAEAFTKDVIITAFRNTGIPLLDLQRIAKMSSILTKKGRFSLFSSSFTNKTKTITQLSQMFSIE
jgi:hypothetical protein